MAERNERRRKKQGDPAIATVFSSDRAGVLAQGFVATLFFGCLPLCLPELFPTRVRATGSGLSYNSGRFATALGVLFAGTLFTALGGSYSRVGAVTGLIYALGMIVIWFAPNTSRASLKD